MSNWLERTELLLGEEKLNLLRNANVLVVGSWISTIVESFSSFLAF